MLVKTEDIPFLKQCPNDGRIRPLITHFDGKEWHSYFPQADHQILDFKFVDYVSGVYLAAEPAEAGDIEIPLLTFLFQRFPTIETFAAFELLHADLENSLAVLHKQFILFHHFDNNEDLNYRRVIATEIEYALFNHRSAYDLLNRLVIAFLKRHGFDEKTIPDSFRRVAEKSPKDRFDYGISAPLSDFYVAKNDRFMLFRSVRDAIGHHGHSIDLVFKMPNGFGISGDSLVGRKLQEGGLWDALKPIPNNIGSVFAFVALLSDDLFVALHDFTEAFIASFEGLPIQTAPGYHVFTRSRLSEHRSLLKDYIANPWRFGKL